MLSRLVASRTECKRIEAAHRRRRLATSVAIPSSAGTPNASGRTPPELSVLRSVMWTSRAGLTARPSGADEGFVPRQNDDVDGRLSPGHGFDGPVDLRGLAESNLGYVLGPLLGQSSGST